MKEKLTYRLRLGVLFFICLFSTQIIFAQNGVRIAATTGTADASAMLDVVSTTKGFLVPRVPLTGPALTNPAPVTSPADGLLVYNTGGGGVAAKGFYYWDASLPAWVQLTAGGLSGSGTANYITKWTNTTALGNSVMYENTGNIGVSTTAPVSKLQVSGNLSVGTVASAGATGMVQITNGGASPINNRLTYGTDGTGWKFAIGKNQAGTVTDQMIISDNGNVGIATATAAGKLQVSGEIIRSNTRVDNAERYPMAHSSNGTNLLGIDPSWSNSELQAFFNTPASGSFVQWENDATAPGGWCIKITGAVNVGGEYGSGFPYIPVETGATYYMECWIKSTAGNERHYMGSNEYNENFVSLGGNPGSYGYWTMSNTLTSTTWTKVTGYITGFNATNVGAFELGTKYWTPMALFNYSGTGPTYISGWKVTRVSGTGSPEARRNYQPYGTPTYVWDGINQNTSAGTAQVTVKGSAAKSEASYGTTAWNNKRMFQLTGMTTEAQTSSAIPANGIYLTLPATAGVHNSLLVSFIDFDRWESCTAWVCDAAGTTCTKLMRMVNNGNGCGAQATTYVLGPYNNMKETHAHGWQAFPVNSNLVSQYISGGNLKFLINPGPQNGEANQFWMSGFACVPNPNGFVQHTSQSLAWGLNGQVNGETTDYGCWNNERMVYVGAGATHTIYVKVMDPTRDVLVTFHEHDGGWYGGSPFITVGSNTTVFRPARGIQGISQQMYDSKAWMGSMSFIIPASIVSAQVGTYNAGVPNVLKLTITNYGSNNFYFRGIDTETYY